MNVNKYIKYCLINEYATKLEDGYFLDVEELPQSELNDFVALLMLKDDSVKDFMLARMQTLIDERLDAAMLDDKSDSGFRAVNDSINGETIWLRA